MSVRRIAVVVAGAGARGGYEAGALSVLVPRLREATAEPLTFVGTSAGAINGGMLAATAHLSPGEQAEALLALWRGLTVADVFRSPVLGFPRVAARAIGQLLRVPGARLTGLFDTSPLHRTTEGATDWLRFRDNLDRGLAELAVVTTSGSDNRTVVFVDRAGDAPPPPPDADRPIDYVDARIGPAHILASAAIPVVFPPVRVPRAEGGYDWHLDGGVRLNTPLKPALALGADAVAVVATHPAIDGGRPEPVPNPLPPDVDDTIVRLVDAALVDPMVEDVRTLTMVNAMARPDGSEEQSVIPHLLACPAERGTIGSLAAEVFDRGRPRGLRQRELRAIGRLLVGDGPRRGELLSHLLFDHEFIEASIELGQRDARALLEGAPGGGVPWQTAETQPRARVA